MLMDILKDAPNVFTPNNDGVNEYFSINVDLNPCFDTFSVTIYDRWGVEVYQSEDAEFTWDGKDRFQ